MALNVMFQIPGPLDEVEQPRRKPVQGLLSTARQHHSHQDNGVPLVDFELFIEFQAGKVQYLFFRY
jgi:hypothetical protein